MVWGDAVSRDVVHQTQPNGLRDIRGSRVNERHGIVLEEGFNANRSLEPRRKGVLERMQAFRKGRGSRFPERQQCVIHGPDGKPELELSLVAGEVSTDFLDDLETGFGRDEDLVAGNEKVGQDDFDVGPVLREQVMGGREHNASLA